MRGLGTIESPFIMETVADLKSLYPYNAAVNNPSVYYELGNDIDASTDSTFTGLGEGSGFHANLDGKGFKVKLHSNAVALCVTASAAGKTIEIKNIIVWGSTSVSATANYETLFKAGIIGNINGAGLIKLTKCENQRDISFDNSRYDNCNFYNGGMIALNTAGDVQITDCHNRGILIVDSIRGTGYLYFGGLVGRKTSTGTMTITRGLNTGILGGGQNMTATNKYTGNIISSKYTGVTVSSSYGRSDISITGDPTGVTRLNDTQLKTQSSFVGFDFTNNWGYQAGVNYNYPILKYLAPPNIKSYTVNSIVEQLNANTIINYSNTVRSNIQDIMARVIVSTASGNEVERLVSSYVNEIIAKAIAGNQSTASLKSVMGEIFSKVERDSSILLSSYIDNIAKMVEITKDVEQKKVIQSYMNPITEGILVQDNVSEPTEVIKVIETFVDPFTEAVLVREGNEVFHTVKSHVGQIISDVIFTSLAGYFELKSYVEKIRSDVSISKQRIVDLKSHIAPIIANIYTQTQTGSTVTLKSYIQPLTSRIVTNARISILVTSTVKDINARITTKELKAFERVVQSIVKDIQSKVNIEIPNIQTKVKVSTLGDTRVTATQNYLFTKIDVDVPLVGIKTTSNDVNVKQTKPGKVTIKIGG